MTTHLAPKGSRTHIRKYIAPGRRVSIKPLTGVDKFNKSGASNWRDHKYHVECDRPQHTLCSRLPMEARTVKKLIVSVAPYSSCGLSEASPLGKSSRFTHLIFAVLGLLSRYRGCLSQNSIQLLYSLNNLSELKVLITALQISSVASHFCSALLELNSQSSCLGKNSARSVTCYNVYLNCKSQHAMQIYCRY